MLSGLTPKLACQKLSVLNFDPCTCQVNEDFSLKLAPVVQDEDELQYILLQNVDAYAVQRLAKRWKQQQRKQAERKVRTTQNHSVNSGVDIDNSNQKIDHRWLDDEMYIDDFEYLDPEDWDDLEEEEEEEEEEDEEDDAVYDDNNDIRSFDDDGVSSDDDEPPSQPPEEEEEEQEVDSTRNEVIDDQIQTGSNDNGEVAAKAVVASSFAPSAPG